MVIFRYTHDNKNNIFFLIGLLWCSDSDITLAPNETFKLESPWYPRFYPRNIYCKWFIQGTITTDYDFILFRFQSFELDERHNADYFDVGMGDDVGIDSRMLHLYGTKTPNTFVINSSEIWIFFNSDDSYQYSGFSIAISRTLSFGTLRNCSHTLVNWALMKN